jgi:hypothetical protein
MISYFCYENAQELAEGIKCWEKHQWTGRYERNKDHSNPLFVVDTAVKIDFRNHIFHAVQNHKIRYKSYDPTETSRINAAQCIGLVSACSGLIAPLLSQDTKGNYPHNFVVAFLSGLAFGYGIEPLLIQLGLVDKGYPQFD